ncbi:MAG TPA: endonuclease/exonuclease/phosphatase family protein [Polyangiaceae bacterium]
MRCLRIATLNVWNKSGPWPARLELIRAELARAQPDVLGLQEILRLSPSDGAESHPGPETCQASEIAEGLGYQVVYGPASDWHGGLTLGNALCSRYPILDHQNFVLPGAESGETRALLYARVQTPDGALPVFVTHLNWKLHHGSVRTAQIKAVVGHVFDLAPKGDTCLPPVLMGDFNAEPEADEIRYLRGYTGLGGSTVYFTDAWVYAGDGSQGATFDRRNRFAALAHEPPRRIDYIFVRGPDRKFRGEPRKTELAFTANATQGGEDVWPSDHFGLVTELSV